MNANCIPTLGENLRAARKRAFPSDDLWAFSRRIGVSRATLQKMEQGDLSVSLGRYYLAASLLGMQEQFEGLFFRELGLFEQMEAKMQATKVSGRLPGTARGRKSILIGKDIS